jgi:hypothetical protein
MLQCCDGSPPGFDALVRSGHWIAAKRRPSAAFGHLTIPHSLHHSTTRPQPRLVRRRSRRTQHSQRADDDDRSFFPSFPHLDILSHFDFRTP